MKRTHARQLGHAASHRCGTPDSRLLHACAASLGAALHWALDHSHRPTRRIQQDECIRRPTLLVHQLAALLPFLVANAAAQVVAIHRRPARPLPPADRACGTGQQRGRWGASGSMGGGLVAVGSRASGCRSCRLLLLAASCTLRAGSCCSRRSACAHPAAARLVPPSLAAAAGCAAASRRSHTPPLCARPCPARATAPPPLQCKRDGAGTGGQAGWWSGVMHPGQHAAVVTVTWQPLARPHPVRTRRSGGGDAQPPAAHPAPCAAHRAAPAPLRRCRSLLPA